MMREVLVAESASIVVDFIHDGEPFIPDGGDVEWNLYDHAGTELTNGIDSNASASIAIAVDGSNHTIGADRDFEKRTILVKGLRSGQPFQIRQSYRVIPWLNHSLSPDKVRAFIGVDATILPDADIDITAAYFDLVASVGSSTTVSDGLIAGDSLERALNGGILGHAVLAVLPSLSVRISKKEADGNRSAERFGLDLERLEGVARTLVKHATDTANAVAAAPATLLVFTTRTDPFTGE